MRPHVIQQTSKRPSLAMAVASRRGFRSLSLATPVRKPYALSHDGRMRTMNVSESTVLEKVCHPSAVARHITLIDPAKQTAEVAAQRAMVAGGMQARR